MLLPATTNNENAFIRPSPTACSGTRTPRVAILELPLQRRCINFALSYNLLIKRATDSESIMGKHLVLVGGGHAHLTVLMKAKDYVDRGHSVTLISPVTHHYYSGMGPGMLSQIYAPREVRFHIKKMVEDRGGSFVVGKVNKVDPHKKILYLESGEDIPYDVVSFNTGSSVPVPGGLREHSNSVFPVKPISNLLKAQKEILKAITGSSPRILVVGGGPAGIELTGNVQRLVARNNGQADITLIAGKRILPAFNEKVRALALRSLIKRNIKVLDNAYFERTEDGKAVMRDGSTLSYDYLFAAVGVTPSALFADSGLPVGPDKGLLVNEKLQSVAHGEIFGGGDCISFRDKPIDKVGVVRCPSKSRSLSQPDGRLGIRADGHVSASRHVPAGLQSRGRNRDLREEILGVERQSRVYDQGLYRPQVYEKIPGVGRD